MQSAPVGAYEAQLGNVWSEEYARGDMDGEQHWSGERSNEDSAAEVARLCAGVC